MRCWEHLAYNSQDLDPHFGFQGTRRFQDLSRAQNGQNAMRAIIRQSLTKSGVIALSPRPFQGSLGTPHGTHWGALSGLSTFPIL